MGWLLRSVGSPPSPNPTPALLARGTLLDALAEPPLHGLVGRVGGLLLDALAEAALHLGVRLGPAADAAGEVGLELLLRQVGLAIDALGEAVIAACLLRRGRVLVLDDLLDLVGCLARPGG